MLDSKPWIAREEDNETIKYLKLRRQDVKHMRNERPKREETKFISEEK